jgi:hypothetical protein
MERNLYDALHCKPTLTELATLALYAQAITHPYMRQIWEPNSRTTNLLDLGPLHLKVEQHIDKIISNPEHLVSENATYTTGAMYGWQKMGDTRCSSSHFEDGTRTSPPVQPSCQIFY